MDECVSHGVDTAPLPARTGKHGRYRLLQAHVGVRDHEFETGKSTRDEASDKLCPKRPVLTRPDIQTEHLALTGGRHPDGHHLVELDADAGNGGL